MTTGAAVGDAGVIKHTRSKPGGVRADTAIIRRRNMICGFTGGDSAIMAGSTITGDALVSKDRWTKRSGGMTKMAILRCG